MPISYSAPAKVILSGEHSVVHNEPAIACSLDFRLRFDLTKTKSQQKKTDENVIFIQNLVKDYLTEQKIEFKENSFSYKISSQIPMSQGFGSSGAFCVAVCAAFLEFYHSTLVQDFEEFKQIVNKLATLAEKKFHANPSGIDTAVSCFGGLIYFRKEFDFLRTINTLPFDLPTTISDKLFLINSGTRAETTAELVISVNQKLEENWAMYKKIFRDIGKTTKNMALSIKENQPKSFVENIIKNQKLLTKIGVVSNQAQKILMELENFGIGKITGAGGIKKGSGFLLFYNLDKPESFQKYLKDHKLVYFKFLADNQGLKKILS
jgi:mevalonate kinase